jgi:hypothetical protein
MKILFLLVISYKKAVTLLFSEEYLGSAMSYIPEKMKYSQKSEFREVNVGRRSVEKVMS